MCEKIVMFSLFLMILIVAACTSKEETQSANAEKEEVARIEYPKRAIELILPYTPGGSTDIGARILEKHIPKYQSDTQFGIINKSGGSGTFGMSDVFASKSDGYTLGITTHSTLMMQPLYGKAKYAHDSFQQIAKIFENQQSDAQSLIETGELRALINVGSTPVPYFPEIPLLKDKGYDITYNINTSLSAPKDVPQEIVTLLQEALKQTLNDPEVMAEFEKANLQLDYGDAAVVEQEINDETTKSKVVLEELGLNE